MRPGDVIYLEQFRQTAAGAASTGKVLADFGFDSYLDGVATAFTKSVTEGATTADGLWRAYKWAVTLPSTAGRVAIRITPASGTDVVYPDLWEGEVENQDLDTVYAVAAVPVASNTGTVGPAEETALVVDAYRYVECAFTRYTQAGVAMDLTGYTNARFSVWTRTHSGSIYTLSSGIVLGGAAGTITWAIPENAAFYAAIDTALAANEDSAQLYWDLVADKGGVAGQTVPLLKGPLTLRRYESPA